MASKPQKTLADYLVIAISPALIMLIVGSLVFFLQELGYRGEHTDRMRWILFWVVFAFVLTARIGIEQGREHSITYGLALGVVTILAMIRYADNVVLSIILLLVAWWCADRLTWDCTLVDDDEDASGTGLLDGEESNSPETEPDRKKLDQAGSASSSRKSESRARDLVDALASKEPEPKKPKRAPGRTVLYFSLAALPLFGIGQVLIPATDVTSRTYAFRLLWVYLASALALLLSTSFLGLRRYLRQRRLEMPSNIVRTWIGTGMALILLILACCILLPRPDAAYSVASLGEAVESTVRNASKIAFLRGDRGQGEGERTGEAKGKGAPKDDGEAKENAEANEEGEAKQNQGDAKNEGQAQDNGAARQKGDQQNPDAADGDKGSGKAGEGSAKKNSEQEGQKSEGKDQDSESESKGESAENDKSQAGKSSSQKSQNNKDEAAEEDREKTESDRDQAEGNEKQSDAAAKGMKGRNQQKQGQNQKAQRPNQKQDGAKQADAKQKNAPNNATTPPPPERKQSSSNTDFSDWLGSLAKWIFYGLFALFIAWVLYRYWAQILDALTQLWASLLALFGGRKKKPTAPKKEVTPAEPVRRPLPFAAFQSPFAAGTAERMRIEELIQYSFDALQAWANDRNLGRDPEQTPLEFSKQLGARVPSFSREIDETALLYARVAYSSHTIPRSCMPVLEKLWRRMSSE